MKKNIVRNLVFLLLIIGFFIFLYFFNNIEKVKLTNKEGISYEKAVVEEVIIDNLQEDGSRSGRQTVKVRVLGGEFKGQVIEASSFSGYLYGADCEKGMKVIINLSISGDDYVASVYGYYRAPIIYGFIAFFLFMIWLIGGKKGFKSVIALIFTFICIVYLFLPMIYRGYSPFLAAVIISILITTITMYFIGGFTKKTVSSILGTVIGVIVAGLSATVFGYFAKISGNNVADIEELVFIGTYTNIQVKGILFAGILIASLGAVMDVSMSIASTINEIYDKNPNLSRKELFLSGINVGRDMMGTMSNTLILAFTGGAINTLILIYAYSMKYNQIINMYSIGIEIMQGISGSLGIIFTVPLVSLISSILLTSKINKKS